MEKVIAIVGPTATGKTSLSLALAAKLNSEIINADSTQVYKGLDIGTAKIDIKTRNKIKHHLIDIREIEDTYSVYDAQKDIREKIKEISNRGKIPIIVGGTGLYLRAALYDYIFYDEEEKLDIEELEKLSNEELKEKLDNLDIQISNNIHVNNKRRLIRTIAKLSNPRYKKTNQKPQPIYDIIMIGLKADKQILYQQINSRFDNFLNSGVLEEVSKLYKKYKDTNYPSLLAISYKELFKYYSGELTLEEAVELIKKNTRNYAKRQMTWFNNQFDVNWFNVDYEDFNKTIKEVESFIEKKIN